MYAIIEEGSHQFRIREGDRIRIDRRDGAAGDELVFPKVLLISAEDGSPIIGAPTVDGAQVTGKIVNQFRARRSSSRSSDGARTCVARTAIASRLLW